MDLIEAAITERPFQQLSLMSSAQFDSFLADRGLNVGLDGIRVFVELGVVKPLDDDEQVFHPFQIWPVSRLFQRLAILPSNWIRFQGLAPSESELEKYGNSLATSLSSELAGFAESEFCRDFNQRLLPLLLWIESCFLPIVRGSRPNVISFTGFDYSAWYDWTRSLGLSELLDQHSLTIRELSKWRQWILLDAYSSDPSPDLYLLLRSIPFSVRDRHLRGSIRLAYDLYEMAEMVRLFLEHISAPPVSKEWDPTGHPDTIWVERFYGSQPAFGDPKFLRPLLRNYRLDPANRVIWLVEGDTEEGFILRYADLLGADIRTYVNIRNFGGDGAFTKQLPAIDADLESAREEQRFVTLTFDESADARTRLKCLVENGLVNFPYVMNCPDFELENFTVEELVSVAVAWMSDLQQPINLSQTSLVGQVQSRIDDGKSSDFKHALDSVLLMNGEQFKLSKGKEWGERLANHLISERASQAKVGGGPAQGGSKIERQIRSVIRNSEPFIDYPMSLENLDPAKLEIQ